MPEQIEALFTELMNEVARQKYATEFSEISRYYAILLTDVEKMYAFYMLYCYPTEHDIATEGELE